MNENPRLAIKGLAIVFLFIMRITGGLARGIVLKVPSGDKTRPATDYLREAIFSSLGRNLQEKFYLDLFAGTGAYGLEAISHGASQGVFIEKDPKVCGLIQENLARVTKSLGKTVGLENYCIVKSDVLKWVKESKEKERFDLIFVDPPYALWDNLGTIFIEEVSQFLKITPFSRLIVEMPGEVGERLFRYCEGNENKARLKQKDSFQEPKEKSEEYGSLELVKRIGKGKHQPCAFIFKKRLND